MKKFGFTLAEVLITIGIIGVVAAITLPALNTNVKNTTLEKQTLKFYNQLERVVGVAMADYPEFEYGSDLDRFIRREFNVVNVCSSNCTHPEKYMKPTGQEDSSFNFNKMNGTSGNVYTLADGTVFHAESFNNTGIIFFIDVNGMKGPNQEGYDYWQIRVFPNGYIGYMDDVKSLTPEQLKTRFGTDYVIMCKAGDSDACFELFRNNDSKIPCYKNL